jgi:hypothetical protein
LDGQLANKQARKRAGGDQNIIKQKTKEEKQLQHIRANTI